MRCLVTGVAGFIGSHLAERLLTDGHEVYGIDAFIDYYPRVLKESNLEKARQWDTFTFVDGNLLQIDLEKLLDGVDWLLNLSISPGSMDRYIGKRAAQSIYCRDLAFARGQT